MNNIIENGLLLTVATAFVGYGVVEITQNYIYGGSALLIGAGVFILRGYLKNKGYQISGKK